MSDFKRKFKKKTINNVTHRQRNKLRFFVSFVKPMGYGNNLNKLAVINKTDKQDVHSYSKKYQKFFHKLRKKKINLLEIGVGGYDSPENGDASLRMWKTYFLRGHIYVIDIYDKSLLQEKRIKIFQGSQTDEVFLFDVMRSIKDAPDIIIDDGSHYCEHIIKTFNVLFPNLKNGSIYVVEDTQTSYRENSGGSIDLNAPYTTINYFKKLVDSINYMEYADSEYKPTYFDLNITSIHFYHNLIFIFKGNNNESS